MENLKHQETELLEGAVNALRDRLPANWSVSVAPSAAADPEQVLDATIVLTQPNGAGTAFAVEVRRALAPRDVSVLLSGLGRAMRALASSIPLLVVAPWIGPRAQRLLESERINWVDLTGNVRVQLDYPAVFIASTGATRDPWGQARGRARVRGPKAWRLIRTLVDALPPYGVRDIADATRLAPGYVSQVLQTLDREALIDRSARGRVEAVDTAALVRRWAESYDVLRSNAATTFLAPEGAADAYGVLAGSTTDLRVALTGSFAAVRMAPVAAPGQLFVYCADVAAVARSLRLLPADDGADVVLLDPFDPVVWTGMGARGDGLKSVAPTQVAVDCLTGTGRMPAEGEAVLEWLVAGEDWRRPLDQLRFAWRTHA